MIVCAGRTFVAGADIANSAKPPRAAHRSRSSTAIEASRKPVIAAMHGTPLGGGLEVALACHFRIAAPATRLGLPEIKLGIIPGAGGTQRLPRLVGMDKAMAMILTGDPIPAAEALAAGLSTRSSMATSSRRGGVCAPRRRREAAAACSSRTATTSSPAIAPT